MYAVTSFEQLKKWIHDVACLIDQGAEPESHFSVTFLRDSALGFQLIDLLSEQSEEDMDNRPAYFAALIFALDICLAQFQTEVEAGVRSALKMLNQLMDYLAKAILTRNHKLTYWMPILNSFYDVHVEVTDKLRDAYMELASMEDDYYEEEDQLHEIREMILELRNLSDYDIIEHFFSQSHAMPPEFFGDLITDLYQLDEGQEIALLGLLHPNPVVREVILETLEGLMPKLKLSSLSLTRLKWIKDWYPENFEPLFERFIKLQRKKEVVFLKESQGQALARINVTEVDGSGAQGVFIEFKCGRKYRLCGLLLKLGYGVKDVWITDDLSKKEIHAYYQDSFENNVTLREVGQDYLETMVAHFLSINKSTNNVPNVYLLELEALLGFHFTVEPLDLESIIERLAVQISPFTQETLDLSFKRSKTWLTTKAFTETWYAETSQIDKLVNRCSALVHGVRVCDIEQAIQLIMEEVFEVERSDWIMHFLWVTLWLKAHPRKKDKFWQDCFFIVHSLHSGFPIKKMPVMYEIARQTVINSIETMQERRTYLNTETGGEEAT